MSKFLIFHVGKKTLLVKFLLVFIALGCNSLKNKNDKVKIISPDGKISVVFNLDSIGRPLYDLFYDEKSIMHNSVLGVELYNKDGFVSNLSIEDVEERKDIADSIQFMYGKCSNSLVHYNEKKILVKNGNKEKLYIIFRAYNNGISFRYEFDNPKGSKVEVVQEKTSFVFSNDFPCWGMMKFNNDFEGDQGKYTINTLNKKTSLPLTIATNGPYISISEAALTNYAGMNLISDTLNKNTLVSILTPLSNKTDVSVESDSAFSSPWRVIMIADEAVKLLESNLLVHLNEKPVKDFSWVKPGKATWTWFSSGAGMMTGELQGMNTTSIKKYIDFSSSQGYEYVLIDAGWIKGQEHDSAALKKVNPQIIVKDLDLSELVSYSKSKNVRLGVWINYVSLKDNYDDIFIWLEKLGIAIVKIDFFSAEDQKTVFLANKIIESAAKHHLMLDLHSIFKPTGINRTYPNLLTSEGVMGAEYNKWDTVWAEHNLILPYTRLLAGAMDYTPGVFVNVTLDKFKNTFKKDKNGNDTKELDYVQSTHVLNTRAQELAKYVIYESPLQMVSDKLKNLEGKIGLEFIKQVPTYWDETVGINGEIGKNIVIARRKGEVWYLAGMSVEESDLSFDFKFLDSASYDAEIYKDSPSSNENPEMVEYEKVKIRGGSNMQIHTAKSGGFVMVLKKLNN